MGSLMGFHTGQRQLQTTNAKALCKALLRPPLEPTPKGILPRRDICISGPLGTAKTTLILKCIHYLCMTNKIQVAIARNEKTTIYSSIVPTYRKLLTYGFRDIPANPIDVYGGEKRPQELHYKSTGSVVYFTGVDDSDKLFGNEYSIVFLNEVRRMEQSSYTAVAGRLRDGGFYHPLTGKNNAYLLVSDTNPDHPEHWLRQRVHAGQLEMLPTVLSDNPLYYFDGEETEEGISYSTYLHQTYTGFDFERYVNGEWVAAEGLVYSMFNPDKHVRKIERHDIGPDWTWNATLDYGFSVCCYTLWAHPPGKRQEEAVAFKCIYHSKLTIDDLWEMIKSMHEFYHIDWRAIDCWADHEPGWSEYLRRQGMNVFNAEKQQSLVGVDAVKRCLWQNRLTFNEDLLYHYPDYQLRELDECLEPLKEFGRYRYPDKKVGIPERDDEPVRRWNHFMDNTKYYVRSYMDIDYADYRPPTALARQSQGSAPFSRGI